MNRTRTALLALSILICNFIIAQSSQSYHVDNTVSVNRTNCSSLNRLSVLIPFPLTNQYQTISNESYTGGELLSIPNNFNKYVRFFYSLQLPDMGNIIKSTVSFNATLHPYIFDFSQITTIYPYDTSSDEYQQNIGASSIYIVPTNPTIKSIAQNLWSNSSDIVDYARKCYEYVAFNYAYLDPLTGLHPLSQILADGGGDCGNLSSIYISLLRYKSIPSRHVVTIRPDGSYHIWAEFYLENYGWIPVDVNAKQFNPNGDYFGIYDGNGIVVSRGICFTLEKYPGNTYECVLFQSYEWWYWYTNSNLCQEITSQHIVDSYPLDGVAETEDTSFAIYPNPTTGMVNIKCDESGRINVFNAHGQLLTSQNTNEAEQISIDLSDFSCGLYLIQFIGQKGMVTKQITKVQ